MTESKLYGPEFHEGWGVGPWTDEPDEISWTDEETGYLCTMRRNHLGAWCGYVAVLSSHPAHGLNCEDFGDKLYCHWGITYSDFGSPMQNPVEDGMVSDLWWFGFDCAHAYDLVPGLVHFSLDTFRRNTSPEIKDLFEVMDGLLAILKALPKDPDYVSPKPEYRDVAYVQGQIKELTRQLAAYATLHA